MNTQTPPPTIDEVKELSKCPVSRALATCYCQFKALEDAIRSEIEPIQNECADFWKLQPSEECERIDASKTWHNGKYLTWKGLFLASQEDFKLLLKDYHTRYTAAGFKTESPDHCPLLVAESRTRAAKWAFIEHCQTALNMPEIPFKFQDSFFELNLKLIISSLNDKELKEFKTT